MLDKSLFVRVLEVGAKVAFVVCCPASALWGIFGSTWVDGHAIAQGVFCFVMSTTVGTAMAIGHEGLSGNLKEDDFSLMVKGAVVISLLGMPFITILGCLFEQAFL